MTRSWRALAVLSLLLAGTSSRAAGFEDVDVPAVEVSPVQVSPVQAAPVFTLSDTARVRVLPIGAVSLPGVVLPAAPLQSGLSSIGSEPAVSGLQSVAAPQGGHGAASVGALRSEAASLNPPDDADGEQAREALDSFFNGDAAQGAPAVEPAAPDAAAPSDPYGLERETNGKRGRDLFLLLHEISGRKQVPHNYKTSHKEMFARVDNVTVNGVRGVYDVYSLNFVPGRGPSSDDYVERGAHGKEGMNVEHVWPQSMFDHRSPMLGDMYHLLPTANTPNSARGRLPFGVVSGYAEFSNAAGAKAGGGFFEPPDASKGKIARALLYFYTRYYDQGIFMHASARTFWNQNLETILRWNRQYPPDDAEHARNDRVQAFQGNRNPFVDDYTLADRVGAEAFEFHDGPPRGLGNSPRWRYDRTR